MRNVIILFLLILFPATGAPLLSGQSVADSLRRQLDHVADTQRVMLLSDLCWEYRAIDRDSAYAFGRQALGLARKLAYPKGEAQALNDLGILFIDDNLFREALEHFDKALQIRQDLGDSAGVAALYNKQGIIHQKQGRFDLALDRQLRALRIYEDQGHDRWISYCLNNIAIIHYNLGNLEKSLEYHQKALDIRMRLKDGYGIGASYGNMANVHLELRDTSRALVYIRGAIRFLSESGDSEALGVQMNNLGSVMAALGSIDSAEHYLGAALEIRRQLADDKAIASTLISLGDVYTRRSQYSLAERSLKQGLELARKAMVREEQINALYNLSVLYEQSGRTGEALDHLRQYVRLKEEVYNEQLKARVLEMQERFETQKKEQEITLLTNAQQISSLTIQQQRTQIILLVGLIISLAGMAFFEYYRYRQRQRARLQEEMIRQQEARMKAVIDAEESERKRIAEDLHDGIGQTLSGLKLACAGIAERLHSSEGRDALGRLTHSLDEACSEVRTLSHRMRPKALNELGLIPAIEDMLSRSLGHSDISYTFDHYGLGKRPGEAVEVALYRILQELVNNIICHSQATEASVQLYRNNQWIVLVVEENGVGFEYDAVKGRGIGLLNIQSRVEAVGGEVHYETTPGSGTVVTIRLKA